MYERYITLCFVLNVCALCHVTKCANASALVLPDALAHCIGAVRHITF